MKNNEAYIITDSILNKISIIMQELGKLDKANCNMFDLNIVDRNIKATIKMDDSSNDKINSKYYRLYDYLNNVDILDVDVLKKSYLLVGNDSNVYRNEELCHNSIKLLVNNLLSWYKSSKGITHPLILAIVFHYWLMVIKPFNNYNGIIARLILVKELNTFNGIFSSISIGEYIANHKENYYRLLSNKNTNDFIDFMLDIIIESLTNYSSKENIYGEDTININKLLKIMDYYKPMTAYEIMDKLKIKSKETLRNSYLNIAIKKDLIRLTIPNKPTSRNQMYYKV
jgi:hypothetical protein